MTTLKLAFAALALGSALLAAEPKAYLSEFRTLAQVDWPKNRALMVVCHGHSVPAGYFKTPVVDSLGSYPHGLRAGLAERFPHAVINVVVTAIGGETGRSGAARFERDVLSLRPDIVTIDYSLNDRGGGLEAAEKAWRAMIEAALKQGTKVLLLTPTPDIRPQAKWLEPDSPLQQQAAQVRRLAREYDVGLVDSLAAFEQAVRDGADIATLMSQGNHPNAQGHALVSRALLEWFR